MTRIAYFGGRGVAATSFHRFTALQRLGYDAIQFDPLEALPQQVRGRVTGPVNYRTGYALLQRRVKRWIEGLDLIGLRPDVIWVDSGEFFGREAVGLLKATGAAMVLYNCDDPTGTRDLGRWASLRGALDLYDLCVTIRTDTCEEFARWGVRNRMQVRRSYDEVMHRPFETLANIPQALRSDVAFIGTWMRGEARDRFLSRLIEAGAPLSVWGNQWQKGESWREVASSWRGPGIVGRDYVAAVQGAKICLGLLSRGNRDEHTGRSVEIPYIGSVLCAQRTPEHEAMYKDGVEAVFWRDADECARLCLELLSDDARREAIRLAGMKRVRELGAGNEDVCAAILDRLATVA